MIPHRAHVILEVQLRHWLILKFASEFNAPESSSFESLCYMTRNLAEHYNWPIDGLMVEGDGLQRTASYWNRPLVYSRPLDMFDIIWNQRLYFGHEMRVIQKVNPWDEDLSEIFIRSLSWWSTRKCLARWSRDSCVHAFWLRLEVVLMWIIPQHFIEEISMAACFLTRLDSIEYFIATCTVSQTLPRKSQMKCRTRQVNHDPYNLLNYIIMYFERLLCLQFENPTCPKLIIIYWI